MNNCRNCKVKAGGIRLNASRKRKSFLNTSEVAHVVWQSYVNQTTAFARLIKIHWRSI